jgi:predicted AAA+ superfamily ATPase
MKRIIDHFLLAWKTNPHRKPLLLRGARQVGKTYAARQLGTTFTHCIEINFEQLPAAATIFTKDLDVVRILRELSAFTGQTIIPGETLLFFDEIQSTPLVLTALRYFYETIPSLHIIAAGSLLDFTIEEHGIPVGRVESLYVYPFSYMEYLIATKNHLLARLIMEHAPEQALSEPLHTKAIGLLGEYLAVGGMPYALTQWIHEKNVLTIQKHHWPLLDTYRHDFGKYSRTRAIKYVELVFNQIPLQLGRKFKYSIIEGDYRKRELAPALDLLVTAGVAHKIHYASGSALPLNATLDHQDYKTLFLDCGLSQTALGLSTAGWFLNPTHETTTKGPLVEAFVGQEILAYSTPYRKEQLYYWHKESQSLTTEIDYLVSLNNTIIPIEVKAAAGTTLRSMHNFLTAHQASPYGIKFSTQNYSVYDKIRSYPLYAVAAALKEQNSEVYAALMTLCEK